MMIAPMLCIGKHTRGGACCPSCVDKWDTCGVGPAPYRAAGPVKYFDFQRAMMMDVDQLRYDPGSGGHPAGETAGRAAKGCSARPTASCAKPSSRAALGASIASPIV